MEQTANRSAFGDALQKLETDLRDLSNHAVYGTISPSNIPLIDFSVSDIPEVILNQFDLDFCTGFATSEDGTSLECSDASLVDYLTKKGLPSTASDRANLAFARALVSSPQEYMNLLVAKQNGAVNLQLISLLMKENGDYMDPLFQFQAIKQITGNWQAPGADIRSACLARQKIGSIPKNKSPFTHLEGKPTDKDRNFLANPANWPATLATEASKHEGAFFTVDGPYDAFDNIRSALWQNKQAGIKSGVIFGLMWRPEWNTMPGGIINDTYATPAGDPHCVRLIGQKIINGVPYIKMQQSWGDWYGDKGFVYLPRNVINMEATTGFGMFTFKDMTVNDAKYYAANGINVNDNWLVQIAKAFYNFIFPQNAKSTDGK